ncbi:hypothetical protein [Acidocella sp.]|nr:hypothetical protein [Acidocella sp.]
MSVKQNATADTLKIISGRFASAPLPGAALVAAWFAVDAEQKPLEYV